MGVEMLMCCGALIHVYSDNGDYKHEAFCDGKHKSADELARFRAEHIKPVADVTFDNSLRVGDKVIREKR